MPNAHELCRGHERLRPLIELALREGWDVSRSERGHLKFVKPGLPPVFIGSVVSELTRSHRAGTMGDRNG
jgi:hypothetical protein